MKTRIKFVSILSVICVLVCVGLPAVNAETLDIGERLSNPGMVDPYCYSSGCILDIDYDYYDKLYENVSLIFDGNRSTGIDQETPDDDYGIRLTFPYPLFVNNITIFPDFGNGTSEYRFSVTFGVSSLGIADSWTNGSQVFHINECIDGIYLYLRNIEGNNHTYFNDVIINYTLYPTNFGLVSQSLEILEAENTMLKNEIGNLTTEIDFLKNEQMNFSRENDDLQNETENLTSEIEILILEVLNLTLELEEVKTDQQEKIIEKQPDNTLVLGALIMGILGIIIALVAIILISRKSGAEKHPPERGESEDS